MKEITSGYYMVKIEYIKIKAQNIVSILVDMFPLYMYIILHGSS